MYLHTKKELRARFLAYREQISKEAKKTLDARICDALLDLDEVKNARNILVYAPFRNEIDLYPFFDRLYAMGKKTAFPKCGKDGVMEFFFCDHSTLSEQAYGIKEPTDLSEKFCGDEDSICILPCLAITSDGYRLGYGGGYYDRFLEKNSIKKIAAVYSGFVLKTERFEKSDFDIPADIIITEEEIIRL